MRTDNRSFVRLVAVATGANMFGYLDRVCISMVAPNITRDLHLNAAEMGLIFGAFSLSYALFQTVWGAVADRRGCRALVAIALAAWSAFTALTAAAWNFLSLIALRFVFGVSEAVISPGVASGYGRLVSEQRLSTAFGVFLAGGRIGASVAPVLTASVAGMWGWRAAFLVFAGCGLLWTPIWLWGVPTSESKPIPRPKPVRTRSHISVPFVALVVASVCYTGMWQFYMTWFPTYLMEHVGLSPMRAGMYASIPFMAGLAGSVVGGLVSDSISRVYGLRAGRRTFGVAVLLITATLICLGMQASKPTTGALWIALAPGVGDLLLGVSWAVAVEIGQNSAGAVAGFVNCTSNLGAFVFPVLIGGILQRSRSWHVILMIAMLCNVTAAVFWWFIELPAWRTHAVRQNAPST